MISSDYSLELCSIYHSGQIEPVSCFQNFFGIAQTGLILKDVSMEVKAGEVLAVLGSKGSGKRALLEVISRRSQGPTRGQILLDGSPMTMDLFQRTCSYVNTNVQLIPTLTVEQTIFYAANMTIGPQVSPYLRNARVRQVLADLALSQVARWTVSKLNLSEYRRLVIGTHLIKDPAVLLLDEPTADLDPLITYLIISMLSNHVKRRGRIAVLTMEKPRSDVFPFLDKVSYLCLGDVLYTGPTRMMLEYFRAIGFPCPQLENPLMYYLCLSTVDRRSRDRFIESNAQIVALVEKFKMEGGPYRKSCAVPSGTGRMSLVSPDPSSSSGMHKLPYATYAKPSAFKISRTLYQRLFASTFNLNMQSFCQLLLRLLMLPTFFFVLWFFYHDIQNYQRAFMSKNGLLFMCILGTYFVSIVNTAYLFSTFRNAYFEENRDGLYSGPIFLLTYWIFSIVFSGISTAAGSYIIFQVTNLRSTYEWYMFAATLWGCYLFAEQATIAIMMFVRSVTMSVVSSFYFATFTMILGTGTFRAYRSMPEWLLYASYATQSRYASLLLNQQTFGEGRLYNLPQDENLICSTTGFVSEQFACRYLDGNAYLNERYGEQASDILDSEFNTIATFLFPLIAAMLNFVLYIIPLPTFAKDKFRY